MSEGPRTLIRMASRVVRRGGHSVDRADAVPTGSLVGAIEDWLLAQVLTAPAESVFWAPHGWQRADDWLPVSSVEQLAVRISTSWAPRGNVCFASGGRGRGGRNVGAIALIGRDEVGWALNLYDDSAHQGDVMRVDYPYDNYDSFSALTTAQISWAWITAGTVAEGLTLRRR